MCQKRIKSDLEGWVRAGRGRERLNIIGTSIFKTSTDERFESPCDIQFSHEKKIFIVYLFNINTVFLRTKLFIIYLFIIIYFTFHAKKYYLNSPVC